MTGRSTLAGRPAESGFSLIEMLVVLAILAMVAALCLPTLQHTRGQTAAATAREVQGLFQTARMNAIARGRQESVTVDLGKGELRYGANQRIAISKEFDGRLLVGQELVASDGAATLAFFPDGGSSGAKLILGRPPAAQASVTVPWLTGVAFLETAR